MENEQQNLFLKQWMSLLNTHLKNRLLKDCCIPGSHDSNTHNLQNLKVVMAFAKCQKLTIYDQLCLGVRFLDLRYGPGKDSTQIIDQHGIVKGGDFMINIYDIVKFLSESPDEFIIIQLQEETSVDPAARAKLIHTINQQMCNYLIAKEDCESWFNLEKVTFGDIWSTKKRVLLLSKEYLSKDTGIGLYERSQLGIQIKENYIINKWHDTNSVKLLFDKNLKSIENREEKYGNRLLCSQFVLTADSDKLSNIKDAFKFKIHTIGNHVKRLFKKNRIQRFMCDNIDQNFNIVLLDMIDFNTTFLELIISANIKTHLNLHLVLVGGIDHTKDFIEKIHWGRFLYLFDLKLYFKLFKSNYKQIIIVYSYDDGPLQSKVIDNDANEVLIFDNPLNVAEKPKYYVVFNLEKESILNITSQELDEEFIKDTGKKLNSKAAFKISKEAVKVIELEYVKHNSIMNNLLMSFVSRKNN